MSSRSIPYNRKGMFSPHTHTRTLTAKRAVSVQASDALPNAIRSGTTFYLHPYTLSVKGDVEYDRKVRMAVWGLYSAEDLGCLLSTGLCL